MKGKKKSEFSYAFPKTLPVMAGYLFLGMAYGILMKMNGYGFWWTFLISLLVYAGSLQYLGVSLLTGGVSFIYAFFVGLMLNARHLFYGISMLGKYGEAKRWKPYLIFSLTDETFSIVCHEKAPEEYDQELVYVWISLLDHIYWVLGSILGSVAGGLITFDTTGLDFALTALFVVIFTEQWQSGKGRRPALLGIGAAVLCLSIFGQELFMIPSMAVIFVLLAVGYGKEKRG